MKERKETVIIRINAMTDVFGFEIILKCALKFDWLLTFHDELREIS